MIWLKKGVVWSGVFLFWGASLFATPIFLPLPQHTCGLAYGDSFYVVSGTSVMKYSLSGTELWQQSSALYRDSSLFIAFNKIYLYGASGISQVDSDIGVQRWHRSLSGLTGVSHHYPYLVAHTATKNVYIHPDTGLTMTTVPAVKMPVLVEINPTYNHLSDGKTLLTIVDGLLTLRAVDTDQAPIVQLEIDSSSESVEAYIWTPPTLSVMTASQIVFWPHVGLVFRGKKPHTK